MLVQLLRGIEFRARTRPDNTIQWSWGRPGLRLVNHSLPDTVICQGTIAHFATQMKVIMNSRLPQVDKATKLRALKNTFVHWTKHMKVGE